MNIIVLKPQLLRPALGMYISLAVAEQLGVHGADEGQTA